MLSGLVRMHADGGMYIVCGDNQQPANFHATLWSRDNTILIAARTTSNGTQLVSMGERASIVIGEDCMFSTGVWMKTSDMHCIVDIETQQIVNKNGNVGDVVLGKHVWIGQDVLVVLGVKIGSGAIVGAKSFVNKDIPDCTLSVGTPARELRSGVTWLRSHAFVASEYAAVRDDLGLD
jgi:carbonic anhydrase/acetyltransferase-like protein (isoleucine patch superfamily)